MLRAIVEMQTDQRVPREYLKVFGSEVVAYVFILGNTLLNRPGADIEDMIEAANKATGPYKIAVLDALSAMQSRLANDEKAFRDWLKSNRLKL